MKFTKTILASVAIILLLTSCSFVRIPEQNAESEIYSKVMSYGFSHAGSENLEFCKGKGLIINSLTEDFRTVTTNLKTAKDYFPPLEQETWENFVQVNSQQIPFPSGLDLGCQYTLSDTKQNPPNQSPENCSVIHFLSQIGFNSRKDQALVSHVQSCGLYSCGSLYFVKLIDGHWSVTDLDEVVCA